MIANLVVEVFQRKPILTERDWNELEAILFRLKYNNNNSPKQEEASPPPRGRSLRITEEPADTQFFSTPNYGPPEYSLQFRILSSTTWSQAIQQQQQLGTIELQHSAATSKLHTTTATEDSHRFVVHHMWSITIVWIVMNFFIYLAYNYKWYHRLSLTASDYIAVKSRQSSDYALSRPWLALPRIEHSRRVTFKWDIWFHDSSTVPYALFV